MTARERILMIRLINKLEKHPEWACTLGIRSSGGKRPSAERGRCKNASDVTGR